MLTLHKLQPLGLGIFSHPQPLSWGGGWGTRQCCILTLLYLDSRFSWGHSAVLPWMSGRAQTGKTTRLPACLPRYRWETKSGPPEHKSLANVFASLPSESLVGPDTGADFSMEHAADDFTVAGLSNILIAKQSHPHLLLPVHPHGFYGCCPGDAVPPSGLFPFLPSLIPLCHILFSVMLKPLLP